MLLVTSGFNNFYELGNTEAFIVLPSNQSEQPSIARCQPVPFQTQSMHALTAPTGGVLKANKSETTYQYVPIVCGGTQNREGSDKCYHIDTDNAYFPTEVAMMREPRASAASIPVLDGTTLWVTGGSLFDLPLATTELIKVSALSAVDKTLAEEGIQLPLPMSGHCLEAINGKTAILYGGSTWTGFPDARVRPVWTIDNIDKMGVPNHQNSWTERKSMKRGRIFHSCGVIRVDSTRKFVVAAGGHGSNDNTVELLPVDEDSHGNIVINDSWQDGPPMLENLRISASATTEDQSTLLLAGGIVEATGQVSDAIYSFRCQGGPCWWTKDSKMEIRRFGAIALIIPPATTKNYTGCTSVFFNVFF